MHKATTNYQKLFVVNFFHFNPLGPIAPKVAHLTSYCFVASPFETKLAHELVFILVVC